MKKIVRQKRNKEIAKLFWEEHWPKKRIARTLVLDITTVRDILGKEEAPQPLTTQVPIQPSTQVKKEGKKKLEDYTLEEAEGITKLIEKVLEKVGG